MGLIETIDSYGMVGSKIAHVYRGSKITYTQLKEKSDALACYLIDEFGNDKTPVVVHGHKQNEMMVCFLACVKAGHAYIPVDSSLPFERVRGIVESSGACIILCVEELSDRIDAYNVKDNSWINTTISEYMGHIPEMGYRVKDDDIYYIIYTSGSTGKPKGVQITLACLESFVRWGLTLYSHHAEGMDTFLNQAPFSFDLSVMDLYLSLVTGSTLFSVDKRMISDLRDLFANLKESDVSVWVSTPSFAEMCLADKSFNRELLPRMTTLLFCGELLTNECAERLHERFAGVKVVNLYGPTEATVAVTAVDINVETCKKINPLPVGYVKEDCKIIIADQNGMEVERGEKGEILIAGDSVSPGYYKNEEMTHKAFSRITIDGVEKMCYRTGDEGYVSNGLLYYCGRIDFQIKLNGYRIELEDIESNLRRLEDVKNAVVIPVFEDLRVKYLTAVVVLNYKLEGSQMEAGIMIKSKLKQILPGYMIPRRIMVREALPMNTNGKVDRKRLLEELA